MEEIFKILQKRLRTRQTRCVEILAEVKKATEYEDLKKLIAILKEDKVLLSDYLEEGDYYIDLEDLKTLPKEE